MIKRNNYFTTLIINFFRYLKCFVPKSETNGVDFLVNINMLIRSPRHDMVKKKFNCGLNIAITCTRNINSWPQNIKLWLQNTNSGPRNKNNVRTKYKLIILISFLQFLVRKKLLTAEKTCQRPQKNKQACLFML